LGKRVGPFYVPDFFSSKAKASRSNIFQLFFAKKPLFGSTGEQQSCSINEGLALCLTFFSHEPIFTTCRWAYPAFFLADVDPAYSIDVLIIGVCFSFFLAIYFQHQAMRGFLRPFMVLFFLCLFQTSSMFAQTCAPAAGSVSLLKTRVCPRDTFAVQLSGQQTDTAYASELWLCDTNRVFCKKPCLAGALPKFPLVNT
jgi:hypothetical protein